MAINNISFLTNKQKWLLSGIISLIALVVFSPIVVMLLGNLTSNPLVTYAGSATVGLYLLLSVLFMAIIRLLYEWVDMCSVERWRYALLTMVIALIVFAPFFNSAILLALNGGPNLGYSCLIFLIQVIIFFFIIRLTLL